VRVARLICVLSCCWQAALAQTAFFPLSQIKAGQRATGKTVFSGYKIEEFQVEILGVLENLGPKQSLILARLSGGPLETTGVLQGMSGSPVYIDGKLVGAVAMAFPFSKEPIAGIRPIQEMLSVDTAPASQPPDLAAAAWQRGEAKDSSPAEERLVDIATPVSFGGFTRSTLDYFAPQLRALGLEPRQALSGGGRPEPAGADTSVEPGAMISVQLVAGDLSMGADGTVTHVDGNRIYAFGHRLLSAGEVQMPFAKSEVLALLPNVNSSFKISSARQWLGTITQDRSTALGGQLGMRPAMMPLSISVTSGGRKFKYDVEVVYERFLTPFLTQVAIYSAIDATERGVGAATLRVQGQIDFQGKSEPVKIDNSYSAEFGAPAIASMGATLPLMYAMQSGIKDLKIRGVSLAIDSVEGKNQCQIDRVYPGRGTYRPGETAELFVALAREDGAEIVRKVEYRIPIGAAAGALYFTVADGAYVNAADARQWTSAGARSSTQLISLLNNLKRNNSAWVRVWRADQSYQVRGEDLFSPPPSVALILGKAQGAIGSQPLARPSRLAEFEVPFGDYVVSGSRTIQVEVKE
jgi:hypothetical protein